MDISHSSPADCVSLSIAAMGLELTVRLPSATTHAALAVLETVNSPGFGPPLHRHMESEIFRVLEGEYLYEVASQQFKASAGDIITVPGGVAHTFLNIGSQPARQLIIMLPAMDAYSFFAGLGDLMAEGRPTLDVLNEYGKKWTVEFLGPPLRSQSGRRET